MRSGNWEDDDRIALARSRWMSEVAKTVDRASLAGINPFDDSRLEFREKIPGYYSGSTGRGTWSSQGRVPSFVVAEPGSLGLVFTEGELWPISFRGEGGWTCVSNFRLYDLDVAWACHLAVFPEPGSYSASWSYERACEWEACGLLLRPRNLFASDAPAQPIRPVEFRGPLAPTGWVRPPIPEDIIRLPPPPRTRRLARFDEDV